ncbi:MAG: GTP-binding protein [Siculibacillus sp.]
MSQAAASAIPVTVLTGYLGAGKTTLLNRILSEDHGKKYAVIVNEFGEVGIDNDLVVDTDEEIFEMNNGCICCTVRGDLIRILEGLMKRKGKFDAVIIETTGLADPAPVAQTFFMDDDVRAKTRLDAIVTVVDAKNLMARVADSPEAEDQVAFADVILLNKIDLVSADELAAVRAEIRAINPQARVVETERCAVDLTQVLDRGAFDLDRILTVEPDFLTGGHHHHDESVKSISLEAGDMKPDAFFDWIHAETQAQGPNIRRMKGIIAFRDDPERYVVQGVHMIVEGDHQREWGADEERRTRLVFIGRDLDFAAIRAGFDACRA